MDYPLHISVPSEADLVGKALASFSRVLASHALLEDPQLGNEIANRAFKITATRECAEFLVCTFLFGS